jgi:hypothetical protein
MSETIHKGKPGDHLCVATTANGPCTNKAPMQGGLCAAHGGPQQKMSLEKESIYGRLSAQYKERIRKMTDHTDHFSLNEEVGILRILLENTLESVQADPKALLRMTGPVSELITRIEKLVLSAMRAEKYIGGLLSRDQAGRMLQEAVDVIAEEISDPIVLERIATRLTEIANKQYPEEK